MRSYTIETSTAPLEHADEKVLQRSAEALFADRHLAGPVTALNTSTPVLTVRTSVDSMSPEEAITAALARVRRALKRAGVSDLELTEASVVLDLPDDEFASARDDLVGTPDVAARLSISRQRVAQLVNEAGRFPPSIARVRGTHIWRWGEIVDWLGAGRRDLRRSRAEGRAPARRPPKRRAKRRAA